MKKEEYLKARVDDQIDWYNKKSVTNKKLFYLFQVLTMIFGALVTLSGALDWGADNTMRYFAPVLGALITIGSGLLALYKFHEKWIKYRTTCESLQIERNLFVTETQPYHGDKAFNLFVHRIEAMISQENSSWAQTMTSVTEEAEVEE